jgi:hypothetical protein
VVLKLFDKRSSSNLTKNNHFVVDCGCISSKHWAVHSPAVEFLASKSLGILNGQALFQFEMRKNVLLSTFKFQLTAWGGPRAARHWAYRNTDSNVKYIGSWFSDLDRILDDHTGLNLLFHPLFFFA